MRSGLDGEPAVGVSLQVLETSSGKLLWSRSGARAGWSRESLAGTAQTVLRDLVGNLRLGSTWRFIWAGEPEPTVALDSAR